MNIMDEFFDNLEVELKEIGTITLDECLAITEFFPKYAAIMVKKLVSKRFSCNICQQVRYQMNILDNGKLQKLCIKCYITSRKNKAVH